MPHSALLKIGLRLVIYGGVIVVTVSLYIVAISVRPPRLISRITPAARGIDAEHISFETEDGIRIAGWYIPCPAPTRATIILCHGYPADKGNILDYTLFLRPFFNLCYFDFRGLGESGGRISTIGWREQKDLKAAIEYVGTRGAEKIGVYGFSMGGAVALMTQSPRIDAVVSESSYADLEKMVHSTFASFGPLRHPFVYTTCRIVRFIFGVHPEKISPALSLRTSNAPVFLIHSAEDTEVPIRHFHELRTVRPDASYWIMDEGEHGMVREEIRERYEEKVIAFFLKHLTSSGAYPEGAHTIKN